MKFLIRRFIAGKTAADAVEAVRALNLSGIRATLDYLGEECRSREQAASSVAEYQGLFQLLSESGVDSNVSLKLTQLGLNLDRSLAKENLLRVLDAAAKYANFVRIDMEGSAYTQRTLDLFHEIFPARQNVGVVIQACLRRSEADIEQLIMAGARVRLCKGAYKEPADIAFQDKSDVDRSYDKLAKALIAHGHYPGIATHDDARIQAAIQAANEAGTDARNFEFQMLYGVRTERGHELARAGYNVRIYVPYGTHWFRYYFRRIRERRENLIFAVRSILGI